MFDFSDYSWEWKFFKPVNEKVIGKVKDEFGGFERRITSELVELKSKMSSVVDIDGEESKKAIVVNRSVVRAIRHKKCVDVLFGGAVKRHRMNRI